MQGGEAVFIPGAHHTGSATQMVVERHLWDAQGNTKHDLDRQKSTPLTSMSTQQEEDLDTCYSSGPSLCLAGLARSGEGRDHARFYATTLKTGHGILFWVAQVVMPGLDLTGWLSFETVLLHGLQGDGGGHKTSKSWGSVIDPLDVISGASLEVCDLLVLCVLYWCSLAVVSSTLTAGTVREGGGDPECGRGTRLSRMKSPTGIPECGADALWSTLCSTSFRKPSPQTMSGGGCVLR
ncbi:valine--tRNA ligase-like isoform X5 [Scylla paramamosain]|uniref:valine--tRNA ligase-like isoform X5 n=1 Tax=Scylla paramamosain TaxID=85552 RepID=UPI0030839456